AALAPLCLCLVAGLQLVRVWTCHQTPWKGGGFGMFSTVDDESARFLRCYLVTEGGDLPLELPPATDKTVAELRTAPTQARLDAFARRLANQSWRYREVRQMHEVAAIRKRGGEAITADALRIRMARGERSLRPADQTFAELDSGDATDPKLKVQQRFRPPIDLPRAIEPIPRDEMDVDAIMFRAVRVECFRYRYDAAQRLLWAEPMLSAEATP